MSLLGSGVYPICNAFLCTIYRRFSAIDIYLVILAHFTSEPLN